MFENLKKRVVEDYNRKIAEYSFYIENGYFETWAEEHRNNPNRGLEQYSTNTRLDQYKSGTISREKAVALAIARMKKKENNEMEKDLARLDRVANAPDISYIFVSIDWVRSSTWGYNPNVQVITSTGEYYGRASGCGYDKESAAVASAFNKCDSILKLLYTLKENGLKNGETDKSETTCTNVDNRYICGYGSGYAVLPYFEGGVGVSCFWRILEKCGYKMTEHHTKRSDSYSIEKM